MGQKAAKDRPSTTGSTRVRIDTLRTVVAVLDLFRSGKKQKDIAAALGLTEQNVSQIFRRAGHQADMTVGERGRDDEHKLTPIAEEYLQTARQVVEGHDALANPRRFGMRAVRVGTYPSVISYFLTRRVFPHLLMDDLAALVDGNPDTFPKRFPLYQIETLHAGGGPEILREVANGRFDFGIIDRETKLPAHVTRRVERHHLFDSKPRGFLFHKKSAFTELAKNPKSFSLNAVRAHTLILSEGDFGSVRDGLLPEPDPMKGKATRVFVNTYAQVLAAVVEELGVGVGFLPKSAPKDWHIKHLPFDDIECPSASEQCVLTALKKRCRFAFELCLPEGWDRPRADGGLSAAARFVVDAVRVGARNYVHDYVS